MDDLFMTLGRVVVILGTVVFAALLHQRVVTQDRQRADRDALGKPGRSDASQEDRA